MGTVFGFFRHRTRVRSVRQMDDFVRSGFIVTVWWTRFPLRRHGTVSDVSVLDSPWRLDHPPRSLALLPVLNSCMWKVCGSDRKDFWGFGGGCTDLDCCGSQNTKSKKKTGIVRKEQERKLNLCEIHTKLYMNQKLAQTTANDQQFTETARTEWKSIESNRKYLKFVATIKAELYG